MPRDLCEHFGVGLSRLLSRHIYGYIIARLVSSERSCLETLDFHTTKYCEHLSMLTTLYGVIWNNFIISHHIDTVYFFEPILYLSLSLLNILIVKHLSNYLPQNRIAGPRDTDFLKISIISKLLNWPPLLWLSHPPACGTPSLLDEEMSRLERTLSMKIYRSFSRWANRRLERARAFLQFPKEVGDGAGSQLPAQRASPHFPASLICWILNYIDLEDTSQGFKWKCSKSALGKCLG